MRLAIALSALCVACFGAITNDRVTGVTATQGILAWTAPDMGGCTVDVVSAEPVTAKTFRATGSGGVVTVTLANHGLIAGQGVYLAQSGVPQWDGWETVAAVADASTFTFTNGTAGTSGNTAFLYLPVDDAHSGLFSGSNLDSRPGSVTSGRERIFVIGKRTAEKAADGRFHSRALETNTDHYYRVTCGADSVSGKFRTSNIALGNTYNDPLPADPNTPGGYAWPEFSPTDRNTTIIDPQTGMLLKPILFAGDAYTTSSGYAFDTAFNQGATPCADGAWTNPCAAVSGNDGNTNATAGNSNAWLVLRINNLAWNGYTKDPLDAGTGDLDSIRLNIKASGTSATDAQRQIDLCLSTDGGVSCATPIQSGIQLPQDTSGSPAGSIVRFGSFTPGKVDAWLWQANPKITRPNIYTRSGAITTSGATIDWVSGDYFNVDVLRPGTRIRLGTVSGASACASGEEYTIASVASGQELTLSAAPGTSYTYYCAPNFALMVRRSNPDAASQVNIENVTADGVFSYYGHFPNNGAKKIFSGNQFSGGYFGFLQLGGASLELYWINPATGEVRNIGPNRMNAKATGPDRWDRALCAGDTAVIDDTNGSSLTWYCVASDKTTGKPIVLRASFTGAITATQFQTSGGGVIGTGACTEPDNWTITCSNASIQNLTPASLGQSVPDQVAALDALYDSSKCKNWGAYASPKGKLVMTCTYGGQETLAWTVVFDPGDGNPAHAGQAGGPRVISAVNTWSRPNSRWGVWHTTTDMGEMNWAGVAVNNATGGSSAGAGPWVVQTTDAISAAPFDDCALYGNPMGVTGKQCSQWKIVKLDASGNPDTVNGSPEPYDPNPGTGETRAPGALQSAQPGDVMCVAGTSLAGCSPGAGKELVKILKKTGDTWVVQRALTTAPPIPYTAGSTKYLYMTLNNLQIPSAGAFTSPGGAARWDFLNDPLGMNIPYDAWNYGNHQFNRPDMMVQVRNGCYQGSVPCYSTRFASPPELFTMPDTLFTALTAPFSGVYGRTGSDGSDVESHAGPPPANGTGEQSMSYYDGRPVLNINRVTWTKVAGSQQLYKINAGSVRDPDNFGSGGAAFNRKTIATHAACGPHALKDLSRPGSPFADGAAQSYTYCIPRAGGECYPGSVLGEVYVNCPLIDHPTCFSLTASVEDAGGPVNDICVGNQHSYGNTIMEASARQPDALGQYARRLSMLTGRNKLNNPFMSAVTLPDGSWITWKASRIGMWRSYDVMGKLPPFPPADSTNRGDFVKVPLTLSSVPPGTQTVSVQFGYVENGAPGDFRCTTRQEACVKGGQTGNDYGFASEASAGIPCVPGCTIQIPAVPQRILYYQYQYRDGANQVLSTSQMQAVAVP